MVGMFFLTRSREPSHGHGLLLNSSYVILTLYYPFLRKEILHNLYLKMPDFLYGEVKNSKEL